MTRRAVIFDLDGTLLDTLEDIADAGNAALAGLGYAPHPVASYKQFVGDGVAMLVRRTLPAGAQADFERALAAMRVQYAKHLDVKTRPYPGIPELLDALVARGVALCVFSNKPDAFCQASMARYFGGWPWAVIQGEMPGVPRKPDPAGAVAIAGHVGVAPSRCFFVGDSPMDMACAKGAGMTAVAVTWGFRDRASLEAAGAEHVIERPEELLGLV